MMTVEEMIKIFETNPYGWCKEGCDKALAKLYSIDDPRMSIDDVAKIPWIITSEWAYKWAKDVGDREVMRDLVTESKWAYYWALSIGDKEVMRDRVTEPEWVYEWAINITTLGMNNDVFIPRYSTLTGKP